MMHAISNDMEPVHQPDVFTTEEFEENYMRLRTKEGRIYADELVKKLPLVDPEDPHYGEWNLRAGSSTRLISYLVKKNRPLDILEVGCGNGWLANRLATIPNTKVTAIDINQAELFQAKRIFIAENLEFIHTGIDGIELATRQFDLVLFAASIQYFPSLENTIRSVSSCLKDEGEIHIIDSHFYKKDELPGARKRSVDYFQSMGIAGLSASYFHHTIDSIAAFPHIILYQPSWLNKLTRQQNPFTWYCIRK